MVYQYRLKRNRYYESLIQTRTGTNSVAERLPTLIAQQSTQEMNVKFQWFTSRLTCMSVWPVQVQKVKGKQNVLETGWSF